jgi:DNA invertase Pin-like site-specific DNA recombinase
MTKDPVALTNRARSFAVIAVLVAAATLLAGPAPARALVRGVGTFTIPEGLAARIAAFRALASRRRRRREGHGMPVAEPVQTPPAETADEPVAQAPPQVTAAQATAQAAAAQAPPQVTAAQATAQVAAAQASAEETETAARPGGGLEPGAPVIGYVTALEHAGNDELTPTERAIEQACQRNGWRLVAIVRDREGGRILDRPGLSHALDQIAGGEAEGLVVNDARLLSRSLDFAGLVEWFRDAEAALIALDLGLDTSTPEGSRVASTLITINGWAGDRIAGRADVAAAPAPPVDPDPDPDVLELVAAMHRNNMTAQAIADRLNADGVPTPDGSDMWWPSTVLTALRYWRARARAPIEEMPLERRASA